MNTLDVQEEVELPKIFPLRGKWTLKESNLGENWAEFPWKWGEIPNGYWGEAVPISKNKNPDQKNVIQLRESWRCIRGGLQLENQNQNQNQERRKKNSEVVCV